MSTKQHALRELNKLGLEIDESVSGKVGSCWAATIDATGRNSFRGECMGQCVCDYTATASEFWNEVIKRGREVAPLIEPCPHDVGQCEFHDVAADGAP